MAVMVEPAWSVTTTEPVLGDPTAEKAVRRIDYDFDTFKLRDSLVLSVATRAKLLDDLVREYLRAHPAATVPHLGCGMDSRVFPLDPPATVRWFDVDSSDVVALRAAVYPAERDGYTTIGSSVTDSTGSPASRPTRKPWSSPRG